MRHHALRKAALAATSFFALLFSFAAIPLRAQNQVIFTGVMPGKKTNLEFGAFVSINYLKEFNKVLAYKGRLDLFQTIVITRKTWISI